MAHPVTDYARHRRWDVDVFVATLAASERLGVGRITPETLYPALVEALRGEWGSSKFADEDREEVVALCEELEAEARGGQCGSCLARAFVTLKGRA